ncbi:MAG TPA: hypothetical protein VGQ30_00785 [Gemmatimonadaceae bacterium]|nr:hypothetical protein [Gemmatimonadaceae bacterium]
MRTFSFIMALAIPAIMTAQSSAADRIVRCESLVVLQQTAAQSKIRPFMLSLRSDSGAQLFYFGVRHSYDPADSQFVALQNEWRKFDPTNAFYEGSATRSGASVDEAVRGEGEPGLLRFLAAKSNVPSRSLEPSREDEVNALLATFTPEQLVMFYSLRPVMELRTRLSGSGAALDTAVSQSLARAHRIPRLKDALPDTAAMRIAFAKLAPGIEMTAVPESWFNPVPSPEQTGKGLFNNVNTASSLFRDVHMYRQLAAAAATPGARVFAEVGRDHIPAQAAALRCAVEGH